MASLDDILYSSKTLVLDDLLHFALSLYAWLSGDKRAELEASHSRVSCDGVALVTQTWEFLVGEVRDAQG